MKRQWENLVRYFQYRPWIQIILFIYQAHVVPQPPKREPFEKIRI